MTIQYGAIKSDCGEYFHIYSRVDDWSVEPEVQGDCRLHISRLKEIINKFTYDIGLIYSCIENTVETVENPNAKDKKMWQFSLWFEDLSNDKGYAYITIPFICAPKILQDLQHIQSPPKILHYVK